MNLLKLYFKVFIILHIFCLVSFSQDMQQLMKYSETYQFDKLEEAIKNLSGKQKETAAGLYLVALLEKDGEKALLIYNRIIESDESGITAERALWRISFQRSR